MKATLFTVALLTCLASSRSALAQRSDPRGGESGCSPGRGYSGGLQEPQAPERFEGQPVDHSGGQWLRGEHDGRTGWFWVSRGMWIRPPPEPASAPAGYWYWCPSARAYYPTAGSCPVPWVQVSPPPESP